MQIKDFEAQIKATSADTGENGERLAMGEFEAIVSVFGNEDSMGDVVVPGAFAKTLEAWAASGDPIPVVWAHDWSDPFAHIGHVTEAKETDKGLYVKAALDLDNPTAKQVQKLLASRRIKQFSFAYDVLDGAQVKRDGHEVYELRELQVFEVGPCLVGANQSTELLAAKAASSAFFQAALEAAAPKTSPLLRGELTVDGSSQEAVEPPASATPAGSAASGSAATPRRALAVATITTL